MAGELTLRDANMRDAARLAPHLRDADLDELVAVVGVDPVTALLRSIEVSTLCWLIERDGRPVFILGCAPLTGEIGSPWLLGAHEADDIPVALTKIARVQLAVMRQAYPSLVNYVDARNAQRVRWLKMLGFTVDPPVPFGVARLPFHCFWMVTYAPA